MSAHPQIALGAYFRRDYENERECEYVASLVMTNDGLRENILIAPPLLCVESWPRKTRSAPCYPPPPGHSSYGRSAHLAPRPIERVAITYTDTCLQLAEGPRLTLPDSSIYLDLPELFSALHAPEDHLKPQKRIIDKNPPKQAKLLRLVWMNTKIL